MDMKGRPVIAKLSGQRITKCGTHQLVLNKNIPFVPLITPPNSQNNFSYSPPNPGGFPVNQPNPGGFTVNQPNPGEFQGNPPLPGSFPVNQPNPGGFLVNQSNPHRFQVNQPNPVGFPMNQPNPGGFPMNQPNPGGFPMNQPNPSGFPINQPNPGCFPVNQPNPGGLLVNPQPMLPMNNHPGNHQNPSICYQLPSPFQNTETNVVNPSFNSSYQNSQNQGTFQNSTVSTNISQSNFSKLHSHVSDKSREAKSFTVAKLDSACKKKPQWEKRRKFSPPRSFDKDAKNKQQDKHRKSSPRLNRRHNKPGNNLNTEKSGTTAEDKHNYSFIRMGPKSDSTNTSSFNPTGASTPYPIKHPESPDTDTEDCPATPEWKLSESGSDSGMETESETESDAGPDFPFKITKGRDMYPVSKVPYIDTHCHLDYMYVRERHVTSFQSYIAKKDFPANFAGCITCFCDPPSIGDEQYYTSVLAEQGVWGTFGLHPHNAEHFSDNLLKEIISANKHPKSLAWGEIGLDYNGSTSDEQKHVQQRAFVAQLKEAVRMGKPIVIHGRGADDDCFSLLKQYVPDDHNIHYHCFTSNMEFADRLREYFPNLFIGITGLVTYKGRNPDLEKAATDFPFDRILVETDSPHLRPCYKLFLDKDSARSNNPGMGMVTAIRIAELRELDLDDVLEQLRENITEMYGI